MDKWQKFSEDAWQAILQGVKSLRQQGMSLQGIANKVGVGNKSVIGEWLSGNRSAVNAPASNIFRYLENLDLDYEDYLPARKKATIKRIGPNAPLESVQGDDLVSIPVYEAAGAGPEIDLWDGDPIRTIQVLPKYALPGVTAIEVRGKSMEPLISDGATVGVVPLAGDLVEGKPYLVRKPPFGLMVKNVFLSRDGEIVLRSVNPEYADIVVPYEGYDEIIVGRIVWVWQLV